VSEGRNPLTKRLVIEVEIPEDGSDASVRVVSVSDTQGCHNPRYAEAYGGKAAKDLPQLSAPDFASELLGNLDALVRAVSNDPLYVIAQLQKKLTLSEAFRFVRILHGDQL